MISRQFKILLDREGAAAERDYLRTTGAHALHTFLQRVRFAGAERLLAALFEDLGDRFPGGFLDLPIEIEKTPAQFIGKSESHGRLAASHEAHEIDPRRLLELEYHVAKNHIARESDNSIMQAWLPLFPLHVVLLPDAE